MIPLPTITMSALVGSSAVVRCPRRNFDGSLCQKDLVELGVGKLDRHGISLPAVIFVYK